MKDSSKDLRNYHDDDVTLGAAQRKEMRDRRDTNRERLHRGLGANDKPQQDFHIIQGSYATKTMTQHPNREYDIDDGAAFALQKLQNKNGTPMTPQQAKEMVRDGLISGGGLKSDPEIKKNCVRVSYATGYHVDIPVYRIVKIGGVERLELASDEWRESNPTEINDWFSAEEKKTHIADDDEPQLRRLVRLVKKYSRRNLEGKSPSGLILTILVAELHKNYDSREDRALREVLRKIRDRLLINSVVRNPANPSEVLTRAKDSEKIQALIGQIASSLKTLEVLDKASCRRSEALRGWKTVLKTDYFDDEIDKAETQEKSHAAAAVRAASYIPKPWGF
jgi:hypothetical protein